MEKFRLRCEDRESEGDWVIESDSHSVDLWVAYGEADDTYWQGVVFNMREDQVLQRAMSVAREIRESHNISKDSDFEAVIKPYVTLMMLDAIFVSKLQVEEMGK